MLFCSKGVLWECRNSGDCDAGHCLLLSVTVVPATFRSSFEGLLAEVFSLGVCSEILPFTSGGGQLVVVPCGFHLHIKEQVGLAVMFKVFALAP